MATSTLTDTVVDPGGNVVATSSGTVVNFRLMANGSPTPGFRISDGTNVASLIVTAASTSGTISQALENNSNITPTGTYYVAEILCPSSQGGTQEWAVLSSSSVSPQNFHDALISAIPSYSPPTTVPPSILSGSNTFTGTNKFSGNVYFGSGYPWVDVRAYGAVGDGITNDYTAVNNAYNNTPAGGTLYFPDGTYLNGSTSPWTWHQPKHFLFEGPNAGLKKTVAGDLLIIGDTSGGKFMGASMTNGFIASESTYDALRLNACHRSMFVNVSVPSAGGAGIRLQGSLLNSFVGCKVSTNLPYSGSQQKPTLGVSLEAGQTGTGSGGSNSNSFTGLVVEGCTGNAINIDNADGTMISGGASEGNLTGLVFNLANSVHGCVVMGMDFEQNTTNITGTSGNNMVLGCEGLNTYLGTAAQLADGTAITPSLMFQQSTGTGFYRSGNGEVSAASNGLQTIAFSTSVITVGDPRNFQLGTVTGTKWGTGQSQKQSWWNAAPAAQQVLATGAGHSADDIIAFLQSLGLCRQS